jgi:hypothetical protein
VHVCNNFVSVELLHAYLDKLDLLDEERLRPGWDLYFMVRLRLEGRGAMVGIEPARLLHIGRVTGPPAPAAAGPRSPWLGTHALRTRHSRPSHRTAQTA